MIANRSPCIALLAAAMSTLTLAGCVVAPAPNGYAYYDPVMVAPPPPRVEIVGVAPYPGHIWITGYWGWNGRAHHWVPGRWEAPRQGHRYVLHRWEPQGKGWREDPGRWERQDNGRRDGPGRGERH